MVISMDRWAGKVAVVTGASAGIGATIVKDLVKNGVIVAGLARRKEKVEELKKKLSCHKGKVIPVKCDLTNDKEIIAAFDYVNKNVGPVQILINNAGLCLDTNLIDGDIEKWKQVIDTNVLGLCIATREAIKSLKSSKLPGHIVHLNSIAGHQIFDFPGANVYSATKYAVTALTETLRLEIRREKLNIKVTSLSPGYVKTDFQAVWGESYQKIMEKFNGLSPVDVAEAVIYVLSTPQNVQVSELTVRCLEDSM